MSQSCSTDQLNALLDFLYEHKDLARGLLRTADGRARAKRLWEELAQLLNSLGGSIKTVQQWQKVWTDRKHLAKKNAASVRRMHTGTGGGPSSASLSQWELRVLEIMGEGFGGPQTTARVPAFPTINIGEEIAQYIQSEEQTQPFTIGSFLDGTSSNGGVISVCEAIVVTEDSHTEVQPPLPEFISSQSGQSQQNTNSTPAASSSTFNRPSGQRRLRGHRPAPEHNIRDRLIQMEREKISLLSNINARLSGIENAILELVKLKQRTSQIETGNCS